MTHHTDTVSDAPAISNTTRKTLTLQLEDDEHLLFEPITQQDLARLYAMHDHWRATLGDSSEAVALCDALKDFIHVGVHGDGKGKDALKRAYMALFHTVRQGGKKVAPAFTP